MRKRNGDEDALAVFPEEEHGLWEPLACLWASMPQMSPQNLGKACISDLL